MLKVEQVSKSFDQRLTLHPFSYEFSAGSTTALLGPSGCGKSTLLRIIMGILSADQGSVWLDDLLLSSESVLQFRRRIGYMLQDGGLFPHLNLRQNMTLMAEYLKWEPKKIEERVGELVELTHLPQDSLDRFPHEISGGQQQRVALMRALFLDPDVILLDEPLGALDPLIRAELQEELREIFVSLQKTVIVVTHDIAEAGYLAEKMVLMKAGQVMQVGSLSELVNQPSDPFVEQFVNAQRSPLESVERGK